MVKDLLNSRPESMCCCVVQSWLLVCLEYKWSFVVFILVNSCLIGRTGMVETWSGNFCQVGHLIFFLSVFPLSCFLTEY